MNFPLRPVGGHPSSRRRGEPTVYHMGDTEIIFGDMALIAELHQPDVVIVPTRRPLHHGCDDGGTGDEAVFFREPRRRSPCHYGSFPIIAQDADGFVAAMEDSGIQVVIPQKNMPVRIDN